jgi:very-short-patch-repair endonuclease
MRPPYNHRNLKYASENRLKMTKGEAILWKTLQNRRFSGYKFSRQIAILDYIVDFYCQELKLAIEVDGESHGSKGEYDSRREEDLLKAGIRILRIKEGEVVFKLKSVKERISLTIGFILEADGIANPSTTF